MICSSTTCSVLLETVVPVLGSLTAICISLAPLKNVLNINRHKSVGNVNCLPYMTLYLNCVAWILYGYLIRDYYITIPNIIMTSLTLYYCLSTFRYISESDQSIATNVLVIGTLLLYSAGCVGFVVLQSNDAARTLFGVICVVALVVFYASPLSTAISVIKKKNAVSLHPWLSITATINSALWTAYGIVKNDPFIYGPNSAGFIVSVVQLILIAIYGRTEGEDSTDSQNTLSDIKEDNGICDV